MHVCLYMKAFVKVYLDICRWECTFGWPKARMHVLQQNGNVTFGNSNLGMHLLSSKQDNQHLSAKKWEHNFGPPKLTESRIAYLGIQR